MGCASNEVVQAQSPSRESRTPSLADPDRSARAAEFEIFADEIRQELDPSGSLERMLADYVIQVAWRLKLIIERQGRRPDSNPFESEKPRANARPSAIERASRSLREAFEVFQACRSLRTSKKASPILNEIPSQPEIEPNEWPIVSQPDDEEESPHYRDRLTFDFEVSDVSPVVKGTWVTVGHVVSLIVDGWCWADILRSHPELTEDDIRACVNYAMDEENATR